MLGGWWTEEGSIGSSQQLTLIGSFLRAHTIQRALHRLPNVTHENTLREVLFFPHLIEEETEA